jgi:hypothetical protein
VERTVIENLDKVVDENDVSQHYGYGMTEYSRSNWDATSKRTLKDQIEVDAETMMNNHEITVLNRQLINLE